MSSSSPSCFGLPVKPDAIPAPYVPPPPTSKSAPPPPPAEDAGVATPAIDELMISGANRKKYRSAEYKKETRDRANSSLGIS